ncbi:MAG: AIPR family protein [Patescibacteria group bacterium]
MVKYNFLSAFKKRKDLKKYDNPLALFALQLFFGIEDIEAVGADDIIVDGPDDGAIDFVHVDTEKKFAVIGQEYFAVGKRLVPRSKKARDLSSALTLLLKVPIEKVPERIRSSAEKLRRAVADKEIETLHIWFVHNLSGSENVKQELRTAEATARALIGGGIGLQCMEVCAEEIEKRYNSVSTPILIKDTFELPLFTGGMLIRQRDWRAFVASVPLRWFHEKFRKYGTDLFSANVRDYMGIAKGGDKNINRGIQHTAENDPSHFWIFNNGMTALVNKFTIVGNKTLIFQGISILNGAQTTGVLGNLKKIPEKNAFVQVRFVECINEKTVVKIKRYNNSQNKIEAPDFRSNDAIQNRLKEEFKSTGVNYLPRRGGVEDIITRKVNSLLSVSAGQVLAAFHGRPDTAYHEKTRIWEDDSLYSQYFNSQTRARHLVFAYSLLEAVKDKKISLVKKFKKGELKKFEESQLSFFQIRGSIFLLTAAISNCLEIFLDKLIANKFRLEYAGKKSLDEAIATWVPIVEASSQLSSNLMGGFSEGAIRGEKAEEAIKKFSELMAATREGNKVVFSNFAKEVKEI